MNPYDAVDRPGAHLVAEALYVDNPWDLTENFGSDDPRDIVGRLIAESARNVDSLHTELERAAQTAADLLAPILHGEIAHEQQYGVLSSVAPRIDVLAARRAVTYDQLKKAIATFRRLDPGRGPNNSAKAAAHDQERSQQPLHEKDPGPATSRVSAALCRSASVPEPRPGAVTPASAPRTAPASLRLRRSPSA
ncbi:MULTISPECIES: hypothetical protein [unclassified Streptomyces]|uniref:hypothetical protein n=1 Tax=unclassified Streptomyces TaxID=2593676 RepID=UPI000DAD3F87|nr:MULTISPECIES: hypothetical protein [unclassified Streptomyces]PZT76813.1 hypothetical protein DNK56_26435 [Streptomyces sp. AC1-42W]PZT79234.1 hypothetical protein DNK55_06245 [Streptomyces sp. AC1-42T]